MKELYNQLKKWKVRPPKAIDFAHLEARHAYFGQAVHVVECLGLRKLMETKCNYNITYVHQFFAIVVFDSDEAMTMTWITKNH